LRNRGAAEFATSLGATPSSERGLLRIGTVCPLPLSA
jgi:hypothetical protein